MSKIVTFAVVLGAIGLVVGYLIFGKIAGEYVALGTLLGTSRDFISQLGNALIQVSDIRRNILLSGAAGVGVGVVAGALMARR